MPIVPPNGKVLVTGANGFIAIWVVRKLLEQGYSVRGAVRSEAKGKYLSDYFRSNGGYGADKFEWAVVPDITKDGAFDQAVKGVDAIEHMASPVSPTDTDDPDAYITPALHGTLSILRSALKEGGKIKRIVVTSSVGALFGTITAPPRIFTEKDWADEYVEKVDRIGRQATPVEKYRASKVLAERSAWEFYEKHKTDIGWDLVTLHPPLVVGPTLLEVNTPDDLGVSIGAWFSNVFEDKPEETLKATYGYIHVEDISLAHVVALQKKEAAGERIIVASGGTTYQATRNMLQNIHPEYYSSGILPRGNTSPDATGTPQFYYANEKGKRILGIKYKTLEEISEDLLADFKKRGKGTSSTILCDLPGHNCASASHVPSLDSLDHSTSTVTSSARLRLTPASAFVYNRSTALRMSEWMVNPEFTSSPPRLLSVLSAP
ncbi:hypothetical protein D9619_003808 [Psilocybe cf. subviscida]|uniref:NAD-dependent epimerase/dehydratase domain-containing protein n=1 Tax=Psilocybe cf. subviscida TaxID=2480587 RepID=A0A8H5AWI4_9AGAR|nr:hypothetical protein D9619_003808 [Psilocybe cf. subviscida]